MEINFDDDNELKNPTLKEVVTSEESALKEYLVQHVGNKKNPEDGGVTVEMILETLAEEFPELVLPIAEENFIRGYQQAMDDVTEGEKIYNDILANQETNNAALESDETDV